MVSPIDLVWYEAWRCRNFGRVHALNENADSPSDSILETHIRVFQCMVTHTKQVSDSVFVNFEVSGVSGLIFGQYCLVELDQLLSSEAP